MAAQAKTIDVVHTGPGTLAGRFLRGFCRSDFAAMNEIYRQYFREGNYPARTTILCPLANPDFLLEIECVAQAGAG